MRSGFGTNNVDHCTRLCHASSVAALLEGINSGAVSNPVRDVAFADLIIVIGANPAANHPVAASFMKNAVDQGRAKLILMDPRETPLARHAHRFLQFRPDADVTLLLSMACAIIDEALIDADFIAERTEGFEAFRSAALAHPPERVAAITGIAAETVREVARLYARGPNSMIFWGMGISQHIHGTDNARCLIALALMTGQIGRRGTGLHPLRGQNNVQGASDAGLIPMMFPDYQRVADPAVRAASRRCGTPAARPARPHRGRDHGRRGGGRIRGMYIEGENPAMSDPDLAHARAALASLEHLVVQDLFLTETAMLADVILPASSLMEKTGSFTNTDRVVQLARPVLPLPGEARPDWWIIQQMARRLGLDWHYQGPAEIFEELRLAMPSYAGISWAALETEGAVTSPRPAADQASQPVLFIDEFPTANGRARFVAVAPLPAAELPDADYPLVLSTGRVLEHWHTGSMTRRAEVLDALEPTPWCSVHPDELAALGLPSGARVRLETAAAPS